MPACIFFQNCFSKRSKTHSLIRCVIPMPVSIDYTKYAHRAVHHGDIFSLQNKRFGCDNFWSVLKFYIIKYDLIRIKFTIFPLCLRKEKEKEKKREREKTPFKKDGSST